MKEESKLFREAKNTWDVSAFKLKNNLNRI